MMVEYQVRLRATAIRALGQIGPGAREAVPVLTKALDDPHDWVRDAANAALRKINTESTPP